MYINKGKKILKDSLDSIQSPLPSVKMQTIGGKVCLRGKSKKLLGDINKLLPRVENENDLIFLNLFYFLLVHKGGLSINRAVARI